MPCPVPCEICMVDFEKPKPKKTERKDEDEA